MGDSFLLDWVDKATSTWVSKLSIVALPPLRMSKGRERQVQRNRDVFILTMLGGSIAAILLFGYVEIPEGSFVTRSLAAIALYRCIDIFITLTRTGIFLNFRGDVPLHDQPIWRVQRILIGVIFNYFESIAWFTVIYRQISLTSPCQFAEQIGSLHQAFNLSFSTVTTIGYGKYTPNQIQAELLAFMQAFIGIILIALVIGSILALLMGNKDDKKWEPVAQEAFVFEPIVMFITLFGILYWLFGMMPLCPNT